MDGYEWDQTSRFTGWKGRSDFAPGGVSINGLLVVKVSDAEALDARSATLES